MKDNITAEELKKALGLNNVANVTVNNQAPTFTQASTRANIASGEKLSVLFGKIMKWFADLKAVAFSGSYSDLSNRPSPLDTYEEITANTESGKFAGALGVQEGFEQLTNSLAPIVAGVAANSDYVNLATTNPAMHYSKSNIAIIGGSFRVTKQIPATTVITLATVGQLIANPICQHNVSTSNDNFIDVSCWMNISGEIKLFAKGVIPVGAYIQFSDCYVYNPV